MKFEECAKITGFCSHKLYLRVKLGLFSHSIIHVRTARINHYTTLLLYILHKHKCNRHCLLIWVVFIVLLHGMYFIITQLRKLLLLWSYDYCHVVILLHT